MERTIKKCDYCGKEYQPKVSWQRFCCHQCYLENNALDKKARAKKRKKSKSNQKMCICCGIRPIGRRLHRLCPTCYTRPPAGADIEENSIGYL